MGWLSSDQEDVLFGAFYVMTEGVVHDHGAAMMRKTYFFLMIDLGQVLRGLTNTRYGWTTRSSNVVRYVDLVWVLENLVSGIIPRYYFFIFAALLVIVSLADALYVFHLFKEGQLGQLWPVKLLRALVLTIVTVSFSALLKWLLIPIECLGNDQTNGLVPYLHGEGAPCRPFAAPDIGVSLPTVVLALLYIVFALVNCVLTFEVNPLSRRPRSSYTGRVEFTWMCFKLSASILIYFSNIITPVTVAVIELVQAVLLLRTHLSVFPFNSFKLNAMRGGIFGTIVWLSVANLVVASIKVDDGMHEDSFQVLQWALIAVLPACFGLGILAVHRSRKKVYRATERLRGEWERAQQIYNLNKSEKSSSEHFDDPTKLPVKRTVYDKFYHSSWETWRAFKDGQEGLTTARLLLFRRREEDKPFLSYVLHRAMEEHPDSNAVFLFNRMMQAFVFHQPGEGRGGEMAIAEAERGFALDHRYIVYAIDRKKSQDEARKGVGRETVSAINLMEFNSGLARAKRDHLQCILSRRKFWHDVKRLLRASRKGSLQGSEIVKRLIDNLDTMHEVEMAAKTEYLRLLANFKTSAQLNRQYADFADLILNDEQQKYKYLRAAAAIDGEGIGNDVDSENGDHHANEHVPALPLHPTGPFTPRNPGSIASGSSENESARMKVYRQVLHTVPNVLGEPMALMRKLTWQTKAALLFIFLLATLGFGLLEFVLFRQQADIYLHLIDDGGHFETATMRAIFLQRSQLLAGLRNESAVVDHAREEVDEHMLEVQHTLWEDYKAKDSKSSEEYFQKAFEVFVPRHKEWYRETQTFWQLGNEYTRRVMMAAAANATLWREYALGKGDYIHEQGNVEYTKENLRTMIPAFEGLVQEYVELMKGFGTRVLVVVSVMAGFNGITILLVFGLFIRSLKIIINSVQFQMVVLELVMSLSTSAIKTAHRLYNEAEDRYREIMEGGDEQSALPESNRRNSMEEAKSSPRARRDSEGWQPPSAEDPADGTQDPQLRGNGASILRQPQESPKIVPRLTATKSLLTTEAVAAHIRTSSEPPGHREWASAPHGGSSTPEREAELPYTVGIAGGKFGGRVKSPSSPAEARSDDGAGVGLGAAVVGSRFGNDDELEDLQVWNEEHGRLAETAELRTASPVLLSEIAPTVLPGVPKSDRGGEHTPELGGRGAGGGGGEPRGSEALEAAQDDDGQQQGPLFREGSPLRPEVATASAELGHTTFQRPRGSGGSGLLRVDGSGASSGIMKPPQRVNVRSISFHDQEHQRNDDHDSDHDDSPHNALSAIKSKHARSRESFRDICTDEAVQYVHNQVQEVLYKRRPWYLWRRTFFMAFVILPAFAIFSLEYPARGAKGLVQFGPAVHLTTHRQYLTVKLGYLLRELVIADGMARLRQEELAYEIKKAVDRMDRVDKAIRLGGDLGSTKGADNYSNKHNEVMYELGCQWKDPTAKQCDVHAYPGVLFTGLYTYMLNDPGLGMTAGGWGHSQAYMVAVRALLSRYGPPESEFTAPDEEALPSHEDDFLGVKADLEARLELFKTDADLVYVMDNVEPHSDLQEGLELVGEDFFLDARVVLQRVRFEARAFYGIYAASLMVFYVFLFRRVQQFANESAQRARNFVLKIPAYKLSQADIDTLVYHFSHDMDREEPEKEDKQDAQSNGTDA